MTVAYERILVPLDGSELAARSLPHAQTLASLANARIILIQVIPSAAMLASQTAVSSSPGLGLPTIDPFLSSTQYESVQEALAKEAKNTLEEAAAPLRATSLQVDTVIVQGAPADTILAYAKENEIDLIVMSTHGRSGLARVVFGSVAENVLRNALCPVLLVRVEGDKDEE